MLILKELLERLFFLLDLRFDFTDLLRVNLLFFIEMEYLFVGKLALEFRWHAAFAGFRASAHHTVRLDQLTIPRDDPPSYLTKRYFIGHVDVVSDKRVAKHIEEDCPVFILLKN